MTEQQAQNRSQMASRPDATSERSISSESAAELSTPSFSAATLPDVSRSLVTGDIDVAVNKQRVRATFELKAVVDGTVELLVTAESAAARFATAAWVAASTIVKKPAFAAAAAALGIGAVTESTKGVLMADGSNDADYKSLGSSLAGNTALSFRVLVPGVGTGQRNTSATYLNSEYAITAAHNVADLLAFNPTYEIATGDNYMNNRGTVVPVASVTIYPGYDGGFEAPDIAIIKFATPLTSPALHIAAPQLGEILTGAGYGHPGTPRSGLLPSDGAVRGWNAPVVEGTPSDVSNVYYFSTDFDAVDNVPLNGHGLSGDSGGPMIDSVGNLVGINIAQDGDTQPVGSTESLLLSQPAVEAWIEANTGVPEPSSVFLLGIGAAGVLLKRQRSASV